MSDRAITKKAKRDYTTSKFSDLQRASWSSTSCCHEKHLPYPFYLRKMVHEAAETKNDHGEVPPAESSRVEAKSQIGFELGKVEDGQSFIFMTSNETLTASSSLTQSDISSQMTHSSSFSSSSSTSSKNSSLLRIPPKLIKVGNSRESSSLPYAQLCFDPETKTLVTLMEIDLSGRGRRSKRLRIMDPQGEESKGRGKDSGILIAQSSHSGTETTIHSSGIESPKYDEPIVLSSESQDSWLEETDLDLYLLHECGDPWEMDNRRGCAEALRKILSASRSLVVLKTRDNSRWEASRESLRGIGYTILKEI